MSKDKRAAAAGAAVALTIGLQELFDQWRKAHPDGDRDAFGAWCRDEAMGLEHPIECGCDCHANAAVWPGPHCKGCGGSVHCGNEDCCGALPARPRRAVAR